MQLSRHWQVHSCGERCWPSVKGHEILFTWRILTQLISVIPFNLWTCSPYSILRPPPRSKHLPTRVCLSWPWSSHYLDFHFYLFILVYWRHCSSKNSHWTRLKPPGNLLPSDACAEQGFKPFRTFEKRKIPIQNSLPPLGAPLKVFVNWFIGQKRV